jgi:hypothetical protein
MKMKVHPDAQDTLLLSPCTACGCSSIALLPGCCCCHSSPDTVIAAAVSHCAADVFAIPTLPLVLVLLPAAGAAALSHTHLVR